MPFQAEVEFHKVTLRSVAEFLHVNHKDIGHHSDQMFEILMLFFARVALHLYYLCLAVEVHTGLEMNLGVLPRNLNGS